MECQYCKKVLKNSWNLKTHQLSTKYCLEIQKGNIKIIEKKENKFDCKFCGITLTTKQRLNSHIETCSANNPFVRENFEKLENKIRNLEIENEKLQSELRVYKELSERTQGCIEEIAKQPKTQTNTTNNTTNNTLNLLSPFDINNKEHFSKTIKDHFTKEYMLEGQKGVARFAVDKLLKDEEGKLRYICTDPSRHIYKFKTLEGDIEKDVKAKKLTSAILSDIFNQTRDMTSEGIKGSETEVFILYTDNFQEIRDMKEDNGEFRTELSSLTTI